MKHWYVVLGIVGNKYIVLNPGNPSEIRLDTGLFVSVKAPYC